MSFDFRTVILHYKPLTERKENIIKQMQHYGFSNYFFYEEFDAEDINAYVIEKYYDRTQIAKKAKEAYGIHVNSIIDLNMRQMSLDMKFGKVFEILSEYDDEYFLIVEDDVIFCENFVEKFNDYFKRCPKDFDVVYMGNGINLIPENITPDNNFYVKSHPASKCSDSIFLTKKALMDLNKTWFPFSLGSDFELSYHHVLHQHKVYWWYPTLIIQGSQNGTYKSCFSNN